MNIRQHIGFGLIPSISIIAVFYIYYITTNLQSTYNLSHFVSILLMTFFYTVLILIFKKSFTFLGIMPYIGFKFTNFVLTITYFSFYYCIITLSIYLLQPMYIEEIGLLKLIFIPIVFILSLYFVFKNFIKVSVTFIKISPRIYFDLINNEIHTLDDIKNYDVVPLYEDNLDIDRYLFGIDLLKKNRIRNKKYNFNHSKIKEINYELSEDKTYILISAYDKKIELLWEDKIYFNQEVNMDTLYKYDIKELVNSLKILENK